MVLNTHERSQYLPATLALFREQNVKIAVAHSGAKGDEIQRVLRDYVKVDPTIVYTEPPDGTVDYSIHKTWNRSLRLLLPEGYDPIFLTDEGLCPSSELVARITSLMEDEPKIGLVGPIHQGGVPQQNIPPEDNPHFVGTKFDVLDLRTSMKGFQEAADKCHLRFRTVPAVESHLRAVRSQIFHDLGLMDENYMVGWLGDSEFCYDIRQKGWETAVCYHAFVYHYRDLFYPLAKKDEWIAHDIGYAHKRWGDGSELAKALKKDFVERSG